jgi:hypothetical protein
MYNAIQRTIDMLDAIQQADNNWLERNHTWVQVAFPLFVPSPVNPDAPLLTHDNVDAIKADSAAVDTVMRGLARMVNYFLATDHWANAYNHNLLRITRILYSISYTLGCGQSHWFLRTMLRRCEALGFTPPTNTLMYWSCAANGLNYNPSEGSDEFTLS